MTPNFTLAEFIASDTAARLGLSNAPSASHKANLMATALCMEQVRAYTGHKPIRITSGYRSPAVNAAVGGVATSAHAQGWAVDCKHASMSLYEFAKALAGSSLVFDQLIYEVGRTVHISFDPRLRRQVLTQRGGPGSPVIQGIVA